MKLLATAMSGRFTALYKADAVEQFLWLPSINIPENPKANARSKQLFSRGENPNSTKLRERPLGSNAETR
jgi:hypothetical protein